MSLSRPGKEKLAYIRTTRNEVITACALPYELLSLIFRCVVNLDGSTDYPSWPTTAVYPWLSTLLHVCVKWREVAMNVRSLWTTIHVTSSSVCLTRSLFMLHHSQPLSIAVITHMTSDLSYADLWSQHVVLDTGRVRQLNFTSSHPIPFRQDVNHMLSAVMWPKLANVELSPAALIKAYPALLALFRERRTICFKFPRSFDVPNPHVPYIAQFSSLTALQVCMVFEDIEDVIFVLSSLRQLQGLYIHCQFLNPSDGFSVETIKSISLPELTTLELVGDILSCSEFLSTLDVHTAASYPEIRADLRNVTGGTSPEECILELGDIVQALLPTIGSISSVECHILPPLRVLPVLEVRCHASDYYVSALLEVDIEENFPAELLWIAGRPDTIECLNVTIGVEPPWDFWDSFESTTYTNMTTLSFDFVGQRRPMWGFLSFLARYHRRKSSAFMPRLGELRLRNLTFDDFDMRYSALLGISHCSRSGRLTLEGCELITNERSRELCTSDFYRKRGLTSLAHTNTSTRRPSMHGVHLIGFLHELST